MNRGVQDSVGTVPPGSPAPFSAGVFNWGAGIPWHYKPSGGTTGIQFVIPNRSQTLHDATGRETTAKGGVTRTRAC
jgi:hypothetical protein